MFWLWFTVICEGDFRSPLLWLGENSNTVSLELAVVVETQFWGIGGSLVNWGATPTAKETRVGSGWCHVSSKTLLGLFNLQSSKCCFCVKSLDVFSNFLIFGGGGGGVFRCEGVCCSIMISSGSSGSLSGVSFTNTSWREKLVERGGLNVQEAF